MQEFVYDSKFLTLYSNWVLVCKTLCMIVSFDTILSAACWRIRLCWVLMYWCHCFLPPHDNRHLQFRLTRLMLKVLTPGSWNQQICQLNKVYSLKLIELLHQQANTWNNYILYSMPAILPNPDGLLTHNGFISAYAENLLIKEQT